MLRRLLARRHAALISDDIEHLDNNGEVARESGTDRSVDRRGVLRLGGMAVAGAAGATAVNAAPATATAGDLPMRGRVERPVSWPLWRWRGGVRVAVGVVAVVGLLIGGVQPASATPGWSISASPKPFGPPKGGLGRVSCPSATSCFAVGDTGGGTTLVERWDGTRWSVMTSPNPAGGAELHGVACPSTTSCFAVGFYYVNSNPRTLVEHWDGTSWSIVASPNRTGASGSGLDGVSCPSTTSCFAVGFYLVSSDQKTLVERWNGASWSIVGSPNPIDGSNRAGLGDVACSSTTSCVAVGSKSTSTVTKTFVERWNGTSWSIFATPNPSGATESRLGGVSCQDGSSCVAVGAYKVGGDGNTLTLAERWNGTSWSIVASPNPSDGVATDLGGVTCVTAAECVAVGESYNGSLHKTLVEHWDGTSWSIVPSPNPTFFSESGLSGVWCLSATNCFAVGGATYQPGAYTMIERWDGTAWSIVAAPSGSSESQLTQVACSSTTSCFAVGNYVTATARGTLIEQWNGTSWSVVASPIPAGARQSVLNGVSCSRATSCFAVGEYVTNSLTTQTLIERWNGTSWSIVSSPNPTGAIESFLESVSCASASSCYAVGRYVTDAATEYPAALIEQWNGTSWSLVASPTPSGVAELHGVSCPSATRCFAVGESSGKTLVERWNGTSWTVLSSPNPTGSMGSGLFGVSCPSTTGCFAVGRNFTGSTVRTLVERWNGFSWAIAASPNRSGTVESVLVNVACGATTSCFAVGHDYSSATNFHDEALVEQWNGTSWAITTSPIPTVATTADLSGVSCPATTNCYAVGDFSTPKSDYALTERYA